MDNRQRYEAVCFGEVLWDVFATGKAPGGAPMNVAYHLQKQQKKTALITRVGIDEEGKKLVDVLTHKGVCTDYIQVDCKHDTGKVYAKLVGITEVVYDIVMPVAWDFIHAEEALPSLVKEADYFVFGTLAARNKISKDTLFHLLSEAKTKVLDVNLRPPHYDRPTIEALLQQADFVKMNLAELEVITGWVSTYRTTEDRLKAVAEHFSIKDIVVTMADEGALLYMQERFTRHKGFKVEVTDTVGSGDAFLAGMITRLSAGASPEEALDFANKIGAFVATQRGACPEYRGNIDNLFDNIVST